MTSTILRLLTLLLPFCFLTSLPGQSLTELPLFQIEQLKYEGAFRVSAADFGSSNMNYAEGPIAYNPINHSVFLVGHSHHQSIAEFAVPALVKSELLADLNMSPPPLQPFSTILDRVSGGNTDSLDRIGGLYCYESGGASSLIVNAYEYYDAPADNTKTTLLIRDASNLATTLVDGLYEFQGGAGHTSGWVSPIPTGWQPSLGGQLITGQSSGKPIISRLSVGPSAFTFDPSDVLSSSSGMVSTTSLMDFSLANPLHNDISNDSLQNDLWTHLSEATYGFIVPGTRTYMTIGHSGGHTSGVCYKCIPNDGIECGGYCARDTADYYYYYWLWDVLDLVEVKSGALLAHEVQPYTYGELSPPFGASTKEIGGASYDPQSGLLYMTIQYADNGQGPYANPPVIVAYSICATNQAVQNPVATIGTSGVSLSWEKLDRSEGCQINAHKLSPPPLGSPIYKNLLGFEISSFFIPAVFMEAGSSWEWRVRCACSINPVVVTPFSETDTFSIPLIRQRPMVKHKEIIFIK